MIHKMRGGHHQIKTLYTHILNVDITKDLTFSEKLQVELCNLLGLCKKNVQKYKGNIKVESMPKVGSTFVVQLPLNVEHKA